MLPETDRFVVLLVLERGLLMLLLINKPGRMRSFVIVYYKCITEGPDCACSFAPKIKLMVKPARRQTPEYCTGCGP